MSVRMLTGDCRDLLGTLPERSVQCVVTSPPYFGLRDYQVAGQIGREPTPEEYVAEMVAVFHEVWRVLRDDGVLWLNLGDSYAKAGGQRTDIKPKDLIGIPWMVAFALRADGWFLRAENIWAKRNGMPESVTDRPTRLHEHVFLLTKGGRYFYDAEAVKEEGVIAAGTRAAKGGNVRSALKDVNGRPPKYWDYTGTRNLRSVWWIATRPFAGHHFAVMPPEMAELCILAGSRLGDTILDPFSGAGTTALVADRLGRSAIGIELNPDHTAMGSDRVHADAPLLAEVTHA